ncbi:MAG: hypothetical protein J4G11_06500 [Acidimicrobiia bacterium]|nr:hypothetical protein [Acidimicrobiia bacterium]
MTAPTFDTQASVTKLRSAGIDEPAANSIVEVVSDATSPLVTRDMLTTELSGLRADMYRALWIQGAGIVAVVGGIVGIAEVIG